mgnify:CR=1 FL=1
MSVNLDLNEALNSAIKIYNDKKITIHQEGKEFPYITIKDDPSGNIKYCAVCFGYEGKLVPLYNEICVICAKRRH